MPQRRRTLVFVAALCSPVVWAGTARGAECERVAFPEGVRAGDANLVLNRLGIRKATMLHENSAGDRLPALQQRIDSLGTQIMISKTGQYLSFDCDTAKGTVADANGTAGRPIEGADVANALLGIFLGADPPNKDLKSGLPGGRCI